MGDGGGAAVAAAAETKTSGSGRGLGFPHASPSGSGTSDVNGVGNEAGLHWLSARRLAFAGLLVVIGVSVGVLFAEQNLKQQEKETQFFFDAESTLILASVLTSIQAASSAADVMRTFMQVRNGSGTQEEFRTMADMTLRSVKAKAFQYIPRVLNESRAAFEEEQSRYWNARLGTNRSYPIQDTGAGGLAPADFAEDYYVVRFIEPVDVETSPDNIGAIGLNILSLPNRRTTLELSTVDGNPALFGPFTIVQEMEAYALSFVVQLPLGEDIVISLMRIPDVVRSALDGVQAGLDVHIFAADENADLAEDDLGPSFGHFRGPGMNLRPPVTSQSLALGSTDRLVSQRSTSLVGKTWTVVVIANESFSDSKPGLYLLALLSCSLFFITLAGISLYAWRSSARLLHRETREAADRAASESRAVAQAERQLNDFLAHEVRNPLSTAISAAEFVRGALDEGMWPSESTKSAAKSDTALIASSLRFIHELLDNIISVNKFETGSVQLRESAVSIVDDVLVPVKAMLERRGGPVQIVVEGESDDSCYVVADGLLLKQVVMNLAKNSSKFVERGFIKLAVRRVDAGEVLIQVQDSGPGIPLEHRERLFNKYQESLDVLRQGSGIGLNLVMHVVDAMGGTVGIDNAYNSGLEGRPGAGFDIRLPLKELDRDAELATVADAPESPVLATSMTTLAADPASVAVEGPAEATDEVTGDALIVDDDSVVRLQLRRRLETLFPLLRLREAASGEAAIDLVATAGAVEYSIIFMDHHMIGPGQPLTGAQTIKELRARGINSKIIGCSANDVGAAHLSAGADAFLRKPFGDLRTTVLAVVRSKRLGRVLIVDDSDVNRAMLERALRRVSPGSTFTHAATGEEALEILERQTFDVMFCDEHMGTELRGSGLAAALREMPRHKRIVLVSLSGSHTTPILTDAFDIVLRRPMPPVREVASRIRTLQTALPPTGVPTGVPSLRHFDVTVEE